MSNRGSRNVIALVVVGLGCAALAAAAGATDGNSAVQNAKQSAQRNARALGPSDVVANEAPVPLVAKRPAHVAVGAKARSRALTLAETSRSTPSPIPSVQSISVSAIDRFYGLKHFPVDPDPRRAAVAASDFDPAVRRQVAALWIASEVDARTQEVTDELRLMARDSTLESISKTTITVQPWDQTDIVGDKAILAFTGLISDTPAGVGATPRPPVSYQWQLTMQASGGTWLLATLTEVPTGGQG